MFDVFLSYANQDREYSRKLVSWLRKCGYKIWIDEEQLVPGSRFRAGLQQGIRESRHMVLVLTHAYVSRLWTQREIDLFDLDADHSERKLLAIQFGELPEGPLDQVILVHQRITWSKPAFDPEAFWKLDCGLTDRRPGPRESWKTMGNQLLRSYTIHREESGKELPSPPAAEIIIGASPEPLRLARNVLDAAGLRWQRPFAEMRAAVRQLPHDSAIDDLIIEPWSRGLPDISAVGSLKPS